MSNSQSVGIPNVHLVICTLLKTQKSSILKRNFLCKTAKILLYGFTEGNATICPWLYVCCSMIGPAIVQWGWRLQMIDSCTAVLLAAGCYMVKVVRITTWGRSFHLYPLRVEDQRLKQQKSIHFELVCIFWSPLKDWSN